MLGCDNRANLIYSTLLSNVINHRKQIELNRPLRALRSMKGLPNFDQALQVLILEESRSQADNILKEKDTPRSSFNLDSIKNFSYKEELNKFERTNPLLLASIVGTISKAKVNIRHISTVSFKHNYR